MTDIKLLEEGKFYELQKYRGEGNLDQEARPFSGILRHHYNPNVVLLLSSLLRRHSIAYEVRVDDIMHAEELPSETGPDGVTVEKVKLWVKKGSTVMKIEPVLVNDDTEE
ncbi:MAG: hypothetical protein HQM14_03600 [SAR324 cluster bacterium]|nr:hypothetical protein [SAR324 cluster bacterium]